MPQQGFLDFVVNLVKLGGLGLGALIFVLVFIILFRNQKADAANARLRSQFLRWGAGFAILALITSTVTTVIQSRSNPAKPVLLGVTISPDFGEAKLPPPELFLMPAGTPVKPNGQVTIDHDATLSIQVRGIVQGVQALNQSSERLLQANQTLTAALTPPAPVAGQPTPPVAPPAISAPEIASLKAAQETVRSSLAAGDFKAAAANSVKMQSITNRWANRPVHP
jgi:hypothetical protein